MKFGETTRGVKRYTRKFYDKHEIYMDIMEVGTKLDMHQWQHNKIIEYFNSYGVKPLLNKSFW